MRFPGPSMGHTRQSALRRSRTPTGRRSAVWAPAAESAELSQRRPAVPRCLPFDLLMRSLLRLLQRQSRVLLCQRNLGVLRAAQVFQLILLRALVEFTRAWETM